MVIMEYEHLERTRYTRLFLWVGVLGFLCVLPLLFSRFHIYFFTEVIIWGLFAMSFNLLLGHTGMLSFGHATFFGIGAYTYALLTKKAAMQFIVSLSAAPVVGLLASVIIGFFCVRNKGLYFSFLTLAFNQMVYLVLYRWYGFTGGEDGIINVPIPGWLSNVTNAYYFALAVSVPCLYFLLRITNSSFGSVLHAIRDNPERAKFSGLKVLRFQLASFSIAGFFGAVAGALYVIITRAAFIEYIGLEAGIAPLFACLLGGMRTFYGPLLGAALIVALDKLLGAYTQYWSAITGIAVIMIAITFPKGILGFLKQKALKRAQTDLQL